jgi:hypothetical protein
VTSTTPALVAEYRYNGLGFRMLARRHHDQRPPPRPPTVGPDRTVNGDDPWYFFCYDERWRIVATFRGSDGDAKEVSVTHAAGWAGGSSYLVSVILRRGRTPRRGDAAAGGAGRTLLMTCGAAEFDRSRDGLYRRDWWPRGPRLARPDSSLTEVALYAPEAHGGGQGDG